MPREISAGAIVFRREPEKSSGQEKIKFLILQYSLGHWDFPRGNIEKGETEKETAQREIAEETGIKKIKFIEGFRETTKWWYKKPVELSGKKQKKTLENIFKIAIMFLAEVKDKEVKLSWEHKDYQWLEADAAKKKLTFENSRGLLDKAVKFLETAYCRCEEKSQKGRR